MKYCHYKYFQQKFLHLKKWKYYSYVAYLTSRQVTNADKFCIINLFILFLNMVIDFFYSYSSLPLKDIFLKSTFF